jgi:hypothetical protein
MLWSSSPTRKIWLPGAASRRARRSWLRSTSWTSSTRRWAQRDRQPASREVALQHPERVRDQVVEVAGARRGESPLVGDERARHRAGGGVGGNLRGRHAEVQLQAREGVVEPAPTAGVGLREELAQEALARDEGRQPAGVAQDLQARA